MKIAIISDLHFGDSSSKFVNQDGVFDSKLAYFEFKKGLKFLLKDNIEPLDYLILNGDILDFSINSFTNSFKIAKPFFEQLSKDRICKNIIYIPGNHDHAIWEAAEWDNHILSNLNNYENPDQYKHTQCGILDLNETLILPEVNKEYGNFFIKGLFDSKESEIPIAIVYPNLYIKTETENIIVTHGHFFELNWCLMSYLFANSQELNIPKLSSLKDIEEFNSPIISLICTGVGEGGAITDLIYKIQQELKQNNFNLLNKVFNKIFNTLFYLPWYLKPFNIIIKNILKIFINTFATTLVTNRNNIDFLSDSIVFQLMKNFLLLSRSDYTIYHQLQNFNPTSLIFGHTHVPTINNNFDIKKELQDKMKIYNTGGWLKETNATIILIDNKKILGLTI